MNLLFELCAGEGLFVFVLEASGHYLDPKLIKLDPKQFKLSQSSVQIDWLIGTAGFKPMVM